MKADIIREKFLKFFENKGHKIVASDSLVPKDDPTVLFTGAGMNQFKEYFLGIKRDLKRAVSSQKCFRTGDIDNVGKTPGHHTFFEMLGNFSFGDYFKKEAIEWAWEFLSQNLKLKSKNLWVSVYKEDTEAYDIWRKIIKVPKERIIKLGDKENFWPSQAKTKGPNGPCGPCSEIFFDQGQKVGCGRKNCSPSCDCDRFVEVWNLVFTQFNRKEGGVLEPLPIKNIDTGMGLERITAVMQGVHSNFQTDLFAPIVEAIRAVIGERLAVSENRKPKTVPITGSRLCGKNRNQQYIYTIADHVRAATFLIADGVLPSNEGRGYVQRMVVRRAIRFAKKLGIEEPFLYKLVPTVARVMSQPYPELLGRRENIALVLLKEEERFSHTLQEGMQILQELMKNSKSKQISGDMVFKLYDTYGFPFDLTEEIAKEKGFKLDKLGFQKAMAAQRQMSRKSSAITAEIFATTVAHKIKKLAKPTEFLGYDALSGEASVSAMLKDEKPIKEAMQEDEVWIILDKSPFYGESGGQVGDTGKIVNRDEAVLEVKDTKIFDKVIVHICKVEKGSIKVGDKITAEVDKERRLDIAKNHTATHLLQSALRKVLGEHVYQSGSLVAPEKLRFDFTHFKALEPQQIDRIEELVNAKIQDNDKVSVAGMGLKEAMQSGAMALFGEKYEDQVRVISIGNYSKELCGGTHLANTGPIAMFKMVSESSISAGTRRIEAITGRFALDAARKKEQVLKEAAAMLNVSVDDVLEKIQTLQERLKKLGTCLDKIREQLSNQEINGLISNCKNINGIKIIVSEVKDADIDVLRTMADAIRTKVNSAAILLASRSQDKISFIMAFSQDLVKKGFNARELIKDVSKIVNGGGGGRPDMAQAGGKNPSKLKDAFAKFEELLRGTQQ